MVLPSWQHCLVIFERSFMWRMAPTACRAHRHSPYPLSAPHDLFNCMCRMGRTGHHYEVLLAVIKTIAIFVMDTLSFFQFASKHLFRYITMVQHPSTTFINFYFKVLWSAFTVVFLSYSSYGHCSGMPKPSDRARQFLFSLSCPTQFFSIAAFSVFTIRLKSTFIPHLFYLFTATTFAKSFLSLSFAHSLPPFTHANTMRVNGVRYAI